MTSIAIIPARGGSRRIPRKNIRPFFGKPIIAYSIETAIQSGLFDDVWVSTDDAEIESVSWQFGAKVVMRDERYASDDVGTQVVTSNAITSICPDPAGWPEFTCCIYATAPMMIPTDLEWGYALLRRATHIDYCYSVGIDPFRDAGQWYWGRTTSFKRGVPLDDQHTAKAAIPNERVCDINLPEDFNRALEMYSRLHNVPVNPGEIIR